MSTIREFYEGNLRPNEANFKNKKYSLSYMRREQLTEKLKNTLSKKQLKLFESINSCCIDIEYEFGREMFAVGYSLGVKFTAEGFCTKTE